MKSLPGEFCIVPMREEPPKWVTAFGWSVFTPDGHISGRGIDNGLPCEMAFKLPYLPGEKCYVREGWGITGRPDPYADTIYGVQYKSDGAVLYPYYPIESHFDVADWSDIGKWRSPVTMPQWAARSFVTILSCEPVRVSEVTEEDCLAVGLKKIDNGRTWKYGMADRDGLPGTDNTGWAWEDWKVDYREVFKVWWHKRHPDKEWAWRVESEGNQG